MPLLCGLQTGVVTGLRPSERAIARVSPAMYALPLSVRNSSWRPSGMDSTAPKRFSTASMSISRTGSPGRPLPGQARHAMTSRSQQSLAKVAVTVSPESHLISNPSEHHPVRALRIHHRAAFSAALAIDQCTGPSIAVARQIGDVLPDLDQQLFVGRRCAIHPPVAPVLRAMNSCVYVRARYPQCLADGLHGSSLGNKGERAIHFFSAANSTASLRISFSKVFLPRMRCSLAISARAAASSDAGTTDSPADTATSAPSLSSLRHWNSRLAATPSWRATSDTDMPGSYVRRTSAAFSCTDHRRLRWSVITISTGSVRLVIFTVLLLSSKISDGPCPVIHGASSLA